MAIVSVLMSTIAALAVSLTAWISGNVSAFGAFGLYIGVGFAVMFVTIGALLWLDARRSRPRSLRMKDASVAMHAMATIPARSVSSDWRSR
ncbi:hypothetical protein [Gymnodinialimonas ulvae]|uniref:hypothetical protein n=1 Tax=Gymnodinialimonas ulvae TaxID=3126504 RepID=UPI0030B77360